MPIKKKCDCKPRNSRDFCPKCSRIKAVILLKNGNNHLKLVDKATNKHNNPVWYSRYSKNGRSDQVLTAKMMAKIDASKYAGAYRYIWFFDNWTGNRIFV